MVEQDIIGHLIDVERLASDMTMEAQAEADRRKAEAKEKAERLFLSEYEKIIASLEAARSAAVLECDARRDAEYGRFERYLETIPLDRAAFGAYLDDQCFGQ